MKNKFYLIRKKRTSFFVLLMVCSGFLCSSVQAQFTHKWNGGTGDWNTVANWVQFTNTTAPTVAGSTTTTLVFGSDLTATVAVNDYVFGGTGNTIGNIVTAVSYTAPNTTVTINIALTAAPIAAVNFTFQKQITATSFPNTTASSFAYIDAGECTLSDLKTIRSIVVGNTAATQGKLVIASTGHLSITHGNAGGGNPPNIGVRGGLITNNGLITCTASSYNGTPIAIENAIAPILIEGDWGIMGSGILTLRNSSSGTNVVGGNAFFNILQTTSVAAKIVINTGSTATFAVPTTAVGATAGYGAYGMILMGANAKARIQGAGFTGPPSCALFRAVGAGAVLDIDAGVTLTSVYANTSSPVSGTINNAGTLINTGVLPVDATGTISNTGSGKLVLQSTNLNSFLFKQASATLLAIAIGDTYTIGASPTIYTVTGYSRAVNANASNQILMTAATRTAPAATGTLTKVLGSGNITITYTGVFQSGNGYLTSANSTPIKVTQERYLSSNQRGWRLLSNPLSDTTYGAVATASTTPITLGGSTVNTYDSANNIWVNANTNDTETWASKSAVSLFVRGRTSEVTATSYSVNPPSNVTLAVTGTTTNAAPATVITTAGRYYLVANPYTAPVSLFHIITASTGLSNTVSYYNPTVGSNGTTDLILKKGGYDFPIISAAVVGDANDVVIPPMGAIFVLASADGTIDVPITAVFTGPALQAGTYNHKTAQSVAVATNDLRVEVGSADTYYDTVALRFKNVGDAGTNIDFGKLSNTVLDAYSLVGSNKMAVSELELKDQLIPLGLSSTVEKTYAFKVVKNTIPAGYEAVLVDNLLNTTTVMTLGNSYSFAIDSNTASQGDARFVINLKTTGALSLANQALEAQIQMWPNPASGQLNISNGQNQNDGDSAIEISAINGQLVHSQKSNPGSTTTIQTNNWAKGVYILKASNKGSQSTKKLIIQ